MSLWHKSASISTVVTRDILLSERDSIFSLNDLPPWMVEEARAIQRVSSGAAVRYLEFFIEKIDLSFAEDFVNDVLIGGQEVATWRLEDCLVVPDPLSAERVFARPYWDGLVRNDGEQYARCRPTAQIRISDTWAGVVGVLKIGTRYWEQAPKGFTRFFFGNEASIEPVAAADVEMYSRRWRAHVLAWWAEAYHDRQGAQATADGLLGSLSELAGLTVTDDAIASAGALAREVATFAGSPDFPQQAGFLGPDDWYR